MARFSDLDPAKLSAIVTDAKARAHACTHLDAAAQAATDTVYDALSDSLGLVRLYATVPYGRLPAANKAFVDGLAEVKGVSSDLREATPVLSLLGTRGRKPPWNDRKTSQGHIGIPLVSTSFVEAIPMIARLLTELGVDLEWVDRQSMGIAAEAAATGVGGVFFVEDAAKNVDARGRHIIPAQDFVADQAIKTVFGVGVTYVDGTIAAMIFFTKDTLDRETAESFMPLMKAFKLATTVASVNEGKIFS